MLKIILKGLVKAWLRVTVRGDVDGMLKHERTLIVANHVSFLDGVLLALFLPVDATFVVHTTVLDNVLFRWALRWVPHFAVDVNSPMAMKKVVRLLETGTPVVLFPEGRLSPTGSLMKIYEGAAFAASKSRSALVRVRIDGVVHSWFTRLRGLFPRRLAQRVTLTVMPGVRIDWPEQGSAKVKRQTVTETLRRLMVEMMVLDREDVTLFEGFLNSMDNFGRRYPLLEDVSGARMRYGDLLKMSMGVRRLTERFTHQDDTVGLLLPNACANVAAVLGLSAGRRVPAMLNYTAGVTGVQDSLNVARITHVLASRAFVEKANLQKVVDQLQNVQVLWLEDLKQSMTWRDTLAIACMTLLPRASMAAQHAAQPAVVLFTSGTEGKPKAVVHSHRSILANVAQVRAVADFRPSDVFMVALPMFHSFGFTAGMVMPLISGSKAFLYPTPLHYRIIPEVVYNRQCTVLFGTNTFLGNYARMANRSDFTTMRYVVAGAEKLTDQVRHAWLEKFHKVVLEGYGVTECAPVLAVNTPTAYKSNTVGALMPGIDYRLETMPGIENGGLLYVKGPNVMMGYLASDGSGRIVPTTSAMGDGWYCTGDIVTVDEDRFVTILDRFKDFAKIGAEMVSFEVVRATAQAASPDAQHAVVARVDTVKGEALVLFTTDASLTRSALLAKTRERGLSELTVPRDIRHLPVLPVLGTGKIDKARLKKLASNI